MRNLVAPGEDLAGHCGFFFRDFFYRSGVKRMLIDDMLSDKAIAWEERDGELWYDTGIGDDSWTKAIDENGFFTFITMKFKKID